MQASLHTHRGTRAIQKMVEYAPSTGGLALWIRHQDVDELPALERRSGPLASAANDGRTIFYTAAFEALTLPQQIGQVAHQVLHVALQHAQRARALERLRGDVDPELFNICADAIVNSTLGHLSWLELPQQAVTLEGLVSSTLHREQSAAAALLEWDLERLSRAIDDRRFGRQGRSGRSNPNQKGSAADQNNRREGQDQQVQQPEHVRDNTDSASEEGARSSRTRWLGEATARDLLPAADDRHPEQEAEQAREWRERLIRAHAGDGAHSMLRELLADLPKVRTPWEHLLRTLLTRGLARTPDQSWSRPSRSYLANQGRTPGGKRLPWEPGRTASRAVPRLVVMVDLSGSIEPALLERFACEIEAISRRLEAGLTLIAGDERVSGVAQFEPGRSNLRELAFEGGGGTDFSPLLREAERYAPDIAVFLTDLDGPADYKPSYPVIWTVPAV
ncbi:vWA domain-containing protein, partial [Halochromatium sp.]